MNGKTIATNESAERGMFDEREKILLERLRRAAAEIVPSTCWPRIWEINAIHKLAQTDPFDALKCCFAFGFTKGQSAERNRAKRVHKEKD